jgi:regulator of sigma D
LAATSGINARFDNQHADINARFDGVTARFNALGDHLQAFESLSPRLDALDERVRTTDERVMTTDGVLCDLDKRITTTANLITDATTRLDAQMKKVDEVATDKLIDYGSRLVDYGSRLGHFTKTLIPKLPKLRSNLDAFKTQVTTIEGRPPNPTTQDVRYSDASSNTSVADNDLDHIRPPNVDNE